MSTLCRCGGCEDCLAAQEAFWAEKAAQEAELEQRALEAQAEDLYDIQLNETGGWQ